MGSTLTSSATATLGILAWLVWAPAGCGDGDRPRQPETPAPVSSQGPLVAAAAGRTVVAEVDGVPIYDDCVRIQAEAHGLDARAALAECIDFELLAMEAERRGYRGHPAVVATAKTESVRRLLDTDIVAPMSSVESVPRAELEAAYQRYRRYIYSPERRRVFHVFAAFEQVNASVGSDDDARAHALAKGIHEALAGHSQVTQDQLLATARQLAGGQTIGPLDPDGKTFRHEDFWVYINKPDLPYDFSQAVFEIAAPGQVSRPTRSRFGWHVTLFLDGEAPRMANVDQAAEWLFQRLRLERYEAMVERLMEPMDIRVDDQALASLQEVDDAFPGTEDARRAPGAPENGGR